MKIFAILTVISLLCLMGSGHEVKDSFEVQLATAKTNLGLEFNIQTGSSTAIVVTIRNQDRAIMFQRSYIGASKYQGKVNLEKLNSGHYYFEVRQGTNLFKQQINITSESQRVLQLAN